MLLGHNIRLIRKKWRFKQNEFGELFKIKGQSISTYEKGIAEPRIAFLMKLSEMTGASVNDLCLRLLKDSEIPEKPYYKPQTLLPIETKEPMENYELLRPEDISEPLYNTHIMVSEFKKLKDRVEDLEKRMGQEDPPGHH